MNRLLTVLLLAASVGFADRGIICDPDSDCFYVPSAVRLSEQRVPALVVFHCNGATAADLDSFKKIGDSLNWVIATCHRVRNHRSILTNDSAAVQTIKKLLRFCPVDSGQVFLFGFSAQGVQALASMYLHPELIKGVVTVCAHTGAQVLAEPVTLKKHYAYLVTRSGDWNRIANYELNRDLNLWGVRCTLAITPGEHCAGSWQEVLAGCRWLQKQLRALTQSRQ